MLAASLLRMWFFRLLNFVSRASYNIRHWRMTLCALAGVVGMGVVIFTMPEGTLRLVTIWTVIVCFGVLGVIWDWKTPF